jgi:glycosyltransferase involved in cell wall biosynthesis
MRSFKSPAAAKALIAFARWLRRRRIAIVHTCDLPANVFALTGAALARVPVRVGSRRELTPPDKTRVHLTAQRLAYRTAQRIVANSAAAAACLAADGVGESRIVVIPNGVDLSAFPVRPRGAEDAVPHARAHDGPVVCTVANLRPEKGHDVLLRAAATVLKRVPHARFRLIGDGPLRAPLGELAVELGIAHAVEFLGHREDVPALLADSDVCAFPSRTEAFPNGLIEGMAAGLPVVASAVGGILELVDDGRNGLLVPVDDPAALAAGILRVLDDRATSARLGESARGSIESRYSFDRMVASFEELYLSELATTRFGAARTRRIARQARSLAGPARQGSGSVE